MCSSGKENYKFFATVGRISAVSLRGNAVSNTGTGPNLTHKRITDLALPSYIGPLQITKLLDAPRRLIKSCGLIYLTVCSGGFRARAPFHLVLNLAVDCLLGTSLIERNVKAILPGLRKIVLFHSSSVAVSVQCSRTKPKTSITLEFEDRFREIRITQEFITTPMFQAKLQAQHPTEGRCFVQNLSRLASKHLTLLANGIMYIFVRKAFTVLLSSFSTCPAHHSKKQPIDKLSELRNGLSLSLS